MHTFNSVEDIENKQKKRVLLRVDFNVPVKEAKITNTFRIKKSLETINYLRQEGAKIILISHIENNEGSSLLPVYDYLKNLGIEKIQFDESKDFNHRIAQKTKKSKEGEILLFENIRKDSGEKNNSPVFAQSLALLGDVYVNDAFSASHRRHASIVGVPQYLTPYAGFLLESEIKNLSRALSPVLPFCLILGGAKPETKLPLIEKFLNVADKIFVLGAPAHSFFNAKGMEVGKSRLDKNSDVKKILYEKNICLPSDVLVLSKSGETIIKKSEDVLRDDTIVDAGPKTILSIEEHLKNAATILWNGPLGNFEKGFIDGTEALARIISSHEAFSVVGGGGTVAAIQKLGFRDAFGFLSTGGGAMLDYLAKGTLPGIEALQNHN